MPDTNTLPARLRVEQANEVLSGGGFQPVTIYADPPRRGVALHIGRNSDALPIAKRIVACWNACSRISLEILELAGGELAADASEWFEVWARSSDEHKRLVNQIVRLNYAPATGYVIEHAEGGRWRTLDSIGMPDWTDDIDKALCVTLREHADSYSADDPEDVRIMHVTGERRLVDVTRERRLAVLGARTTIETLAHMYRGADPARPGDMPVWDVAMPAVIIEQDDERQRQLAAIAEAADYLEELHLAHRNVRPGQPTLVQFSPDIEHYTEGP